jgi:uncharacterized protein (UPF0548 family)
VRPTSRDDDLSAQAEAKPSYSSVEDIWTARRPSSGRSDDHRYQSDQCEMAWVIERGTSHLRHLGADQHFFLKLEADDQAKLLRMLVMR